MFGGQDPFMQMFGEMHRSMREVDNMMNQMMDPFGMMGGGPPMPRGFGLMPMMHPMHPMMGMLEGPPPMRSANNIARRQMRDPFGDIFAQRRHYRPYGFGEAFREMNGLAEAAMNSPNGVAFSQSTMISMDGSGRPPRVVEHSTRRSGDVRETRRTVRDGDEEEMVIGHTIGDREHVLEKKRDKDGNVRKQQRFRNLDESEAQAFDREFQERASSNLRSSGLADLFGGRSALDGRGSSSRPREITSRSGRDGPIITLPEDEDDDVPIRGHRSTSNGASGSSSTGPIIREISDEEAEQSIPKRRRDMFGRYRVGDE